MCAFMSFFFQAEDGIRDADVTGVQTCALPIWADWPTISAARLAILASSLAVSRIRTGASGATTVVMSRPSVITRSEERRVGKERRRLQSATARKRKAITYPRLKGRGTNRIIRE